MSATYLAPSELHEVPSGTRLTAEQQAVVAANLGLVGRVVKPGMPGYEDAFQNGVLGLARAAQKFDPAKGFAFSTYATFWIKRYVQEAGELGSEHGPANYRRHKNNHTDLPSLAALDAPVGDDGSALGDFLAAADDAEADALARAGLTELVGTLRRVAKDDTDCQIIGALLERSPPSLRVIGERHGMSMTAVQHRLLRLRARARHPVFRTRSESRSTMTDLVPVQVSPAEPPTTHSCPDCGQNGFKTPQAVGAHRRYSHGRKVGPKTPVPGQRSMDHESRTKPKLDAKSIKASLYDEDDYDPWLVLVGTADDDGPKIETAIVSTKVDAEQVAALLTALGHSPRRFRLADGA